MIYLSVIVFYSIYVCNIYFYSLAMKILFIERFLSPFNGGVERVTNLLGNYLYTKGIECYYFFNSKDYSEIPNERKLQFDNNNSNFFDLRLQLIEFVKDKGVDVIIIQQIFSDELWFVLKELKLRKLCKVITCFHLSPDYCFFKPKNNIWSKRKVLYKITRIFPTTFVDIVRKYYQLSDRFVLLSDSFKNDFIRYYNLKSTEKLVSISNPCTYSNNIPIANIASKKKQILIVSRLWEKQKNICSALRIWKNIENNGFNEWKLIIAGDGQDENIIKKYAKDLGLERCLFVGAVSEPRALYEESKFFMMTSNFEGFGMTLLEAMQNGCIPFAFDTFSALHDIIQDSYNGYIFSPNDEQAYADKLIELINDEHLCNVLAKQAVSSTERFSPENISSRWVKLLYEITNI